MIELSQNVQQQKVRELKYVFSNTIAEWLRIKSGFAAFIESLLKNLENVSCK